MSDATARLGPALADRYRLEHQLGQGGMATVFLAHDLRHDRKVALKVLRPELAAILGAERFLHEIKTTASLQHPHILPLHDSGSVDGTVFYVMPYVEGESLRDRLSREKQIPIDEAVRITGEVASALDYAHRRGVIHRDIKPENILLHEGQALVADFGIALAASAAGGSRMTETGMSLGTPHYMSPEQAMGEREITARSDVYALGCVLYEMLVGEPPFTGPTAQAIVASVLTKEPEPPSARRKTVPANVDAAVLKALQKLPADRFAGAAPFSAALADPGFGAARGLALPGGSVGRAPWTRFGLAGWALAGLLAVALLWRGGLLPGRHRPVERYEMRLPNARGATAFFNGNGFAIAPDGSRIAYVGVGATGRSHLWMRERDAFEARPLDGTDDADGPFFSPDGRWIAYFANGRLFKVGVNGGAPIALADSINRSVVGGVWLPDGSIIVPNDASELTRVPGGGGPPERIAAAPAGLAATFPAALPRTDVILATLCSNNCARMTLSAYDLRTHKWKTLAQNVARAWYLPTGHLIYARPDGSVSAARFDLEALEQRGPAVPLLSGVRASVNVIPEIGISSSGVLVYLGGGASAADVRAVRVDRHGNASPVDPAWHGEINSLDLSPDGGRLVVSLVSGGRTDLWVKQLNTGPLTRLTFEGTLNYRPAWRPDGRLLSFTSDRAGPSFLYQIRADGSGTAERIMPGDTTQIDESEWSHDGRWLLYRAGVSDDQRKLYALGSDTSRVTLVASRFDSYMPTLSPDGRWLAYVSPESGREEVYVRPFPDAGQARWQVSTGGGAAPAWAHSGRELFYLSQTGQMISVEVLPGPTFRPGAQHALFALPRIDPSPFHRAYVVTPDDRAFIMLQGTAEAGTEETYLSVVLNWFDEVKARVQ